MAVPSAQMPDRARSALTRSLLSLATIGIAVAMTRCGGDGTGPPAPDITPASITIVSGDGQKGLIGSELAPLRVQVKNAAGAGLNDVTVNFSVQSGTATLSAGSVATSGGGFAETRVTLGNVGESITVRASVSGLSTPADFALVALAPTTIAANAGDSLAAAAGSALPTDFEALVRDQENSPLPGVTVTWTITDSAGPGATLDTPSSVTNSVGIAGARLTLGTAAGDYRVSAAFSGAPAPATFTATALVADSIEIAGGDGQSVPITGTLPNPLEALVRDQRGDPFAGVTVDWSITLAAGPGASLGAATSVTDSSGIASNTLTLGTIEGTYEVTASFAGLTKPPAVFTATGTPAPIIASINPAPAREGFAATLTGLNFDPVAANNTVTVDGVTAAVTSASSTTLDITVPETACLPARDSAAFAVAIGGTAGPSFFHPTIPKDSSISLLGASASAVRTDSASVGCVQFPAQSGASSFLVVSAVTIGTSGVPVPERLTRTVGSSTVFGVGGFDRVLPPLAAPRPRSRSPRALPQLEPQRAFESGLRRYERELMRARAHEARAAFGAAAMQRGFRAFGAAIAVGDTIPLNVPLACDSAVPIGAVVKSIGSFGIAVEDTASPAGGFTTADYNAIVAEFDSKIFPTDTLYFGSPSDLDSNGATVLVYTPEVNKLTPPGSTGFVAGFFFAVDLFPTSTCPASNVGEYFYSIAPDPAGAFGDPRSTVLVRQLSRGVAAHEYQHLINAAQRIFVTGGPPEDIWLNEGLSHLAEEVVGHAVTALAPGANLDFATAAANIDDFNAFYFQNFGRLNSYLTDPAPQSPIDADDDLATRGATWSLLRWILDQEATPSTETAISRSLVITTLTGVTNLESAVGKPLEDLLSEWLPALFADDFVAGVSARLTVPSWNLRDIYTSGGFGGYPLVPTALGFADGTTDFSVASGSGGFFLLTSTAASPAISLKFTNQAGTPLDLGLLPRILLLRLP